MSTPKAKFSEGDRVVCTGDNIDGSWEGEEGTIVSAAWNEGGVFAGPRWIYRVRWDIDGDTVSDEELSSSDDFELEIA